ncbi:hypothetical protein PQX77_011898 [Marasmius sp. AFHP31]|nr:hypothetical protein PQX77_011898 [Marasmius sp. AFHP31]
MNPMGLRDLNVSRIETFSKQIQDERTSSSSALGEFIFLNRTRYDLPDPNLNLTILGCTLWSSLNQDDLDILSWSLTDFKRISSFTPATYAELHKQDLSFLKEEIRHIRTHEPERRILVLTHHAPTVEGTSDPKFHSNGSEDPMKSAFATEFSEDPNVWGKPVVMWAFGHTHWNCDFVRNDVRVYSNQRGYKGGSPGFDAAKVVTI